MNLLLDECVPKRPKRHFAGHYIFTVEEAGLKGFKNGALLRAAEGKYDVLVTVDRNIPKQQNLARHKIAILIFVAQSNKYDDLLPLITKALRELETIKPNDVIHIEQTD